jgi:hypothetical protein
MRRIIGLLVMIAVCCPAYNLGLATYAIPFNDGVTAYAFNRGDACTDSVGKPPFAGFYGSCGGWVTDEQISVTPDGGENDALEGEYNRVGIPVNIHGPNYGAGNDFRAGKELAAGDHPTDAVVTFGFDGRNAVQRPTGNLLAVGIVAPLLLIGGAALLVWPRRRQADSKVSPEVG